ncbi:MAG TPA: TonB-dependent receptor [Bacteroidales bacterium]|nr:TonB-dependent receptor [Bacteroidales bacterium]
MMQKSFIKLFWLRLRYLLLAVTLLWAYPVFGQNKSVSGVVKDATGTGIPGVNVIVKGSNVAVVTDVDGKFTIKCSLGDVLTFTFIGYKPSEVTVGESADINVVMQEDVKELNEVVVIGYGVQKKSDLTGAVASVSSKDLKNMPTARVDEALQGKAAGVQIYQNSGQPGAEPKIRVRGLATINGGNPLVIVDGVPGGSLGNINPADIESMEILKDAASAAIYGSAGGNGVILITTKRGQTDRFQANLDMFWGLQEPWSKDNVKVCDAQQYAEIYNRSKANYFPYDNVNKVYMDHSDSTKALTNTNWVDKIFRSQALMQNYNLSVNKGGKKYNVYSSIGYNGEDGTVLRTYNKKYTFRLNSDYQVMKRLKVGESFSFSQRENSTQNEMNEYNSPLSTAIQMLPMVPVYSTDGTGNYAYKGSDLSSGVKNPLAQIEYNNNVNNSRSFNGDVFLKLNVIEGLNFETHYSLNSSNSEYKNFTPVHTIGDTAAANPTQSVKINSYNTGTYENTGWNYQGFLTYDLSLSDMHKFNAVAGFESGEYIVKIKDKSASGVNLDVADWKNFDLNDTAFKNIHDPIKKTIRGYAFFGRLSYDFANIVLLQANIRRDYSSKFGANNRAGTFPAFSAGIKLSEIEAIKDLNIFDLLKVRYGYGETGNSDIQPYLYNSTIGILPINGYVFNNVKNSGAALITAGNADLHWETVVSQNIGLDFTVLKNKVSVSVDYFTRRNKDMLLRKSVPYTVGYAILGGGNSQELGDGSIDTRPLVNYGTLDNSGYELTVGYKEQIGDLLVNLSANITHTKTVIDDIGDMLQAGTGRGVSNVCRTQNGHAVSEFYGYQVDGIYKEADFVWYKTALKRWKQVAPDATGAVVVEGFDVNGNPVTYNTKSSTAAPGQFKYKDINNDGVINSEDITNIGDPNPKFTYGFNLNLEYKGFDLSAFFQGSYGNKIFNLLKVNSYTINNGSLNLSPDLLNGYIPSKWNTSPNLAQPERLSEPQNENTGIAAIDAVLLPSSFYVEDGSYLRLKNIQLGYTLPKSLTQKIKIEKLRVYVGAKNLLTFTKYTGFDPEVGENTTVSNSILERGFDRGTYPQSKMYLFGMNITF